MFRTLFLGITLALTACAPSPLYVGARPVGGTGGEVPRDGQGEPVWSAIRSPLPPPPVRPMPTDAGIPITDATVLPPAPPPLPQAAPVVTASATAAPRETPRERRKRCAHMRSCR